MEKYFFKAIILKCATIFCLLFAFPILSMFAEIDATHKRYKKQDIERDLKNKKLKNTDISRQKTQASTKTFPVDTDNDGMPDSWESDNSLNSNNPDDAWYDPDGDEVVNLFEYQLGSNLNNSSTPQIVTVAQSGADYTDVETAIDSISDGTVIRVAGGTYYVNYTTFSSKVVMIQGGWNSDFSKRNLKSYPTTFDGGMKDEILYFSVSSGEPVIILDGINFIKGNGNFGAVNLLAQGSASMKTSIFNCSITDSEGGTNSSGGALCLNNWDSSQSDRTIGNTIISGNGTSGIKSQITEEAITRWRIINTTISYNKNSEGDSGKGIDVFTLNNGVLTAHIYNSIIWGNEQYDLEFRRNITFEVDHSDIDNVDTGSGAVYQSGDGVVNVDPLFVDPANNDFHLQSSSPVIDAGVNQGIPSLDYEGETRVSGTTVDMGADEYTTGVIYTTPTPTQTPTPTSIPTPTAAATPQEGGDLCGDFGIGVKYSDNNCSFTTALWNGYYCPDENEYMYGSEKRKRVRCYGMCANIEYPDKNTIVVSGKGSLRHKKSVTIGVSDATCKISFKLTFKIDKRYKSQYKKTCKKNNFYVPLFTKVSGYVDIDIKLDDYKGSKGDGKCTLTDSVHITISESKPTLQPISIDCDTEEVIFINLYHFLYHYKKKYLTESGGSLRIFRFSLGSLSQ